MKKIFVFMFVAAFSVAAFATNGGNSGAPVFSLTKEGVGPVKMDMKMKDLPKSVDGLYDKLSIRVDDNDGHVITFYLDGEVVMEAAARYDQWDVGNDETLTIYRISINTKSNVGIRIKDRVYGVGDNVKTLIANKVIKRVSNTEYTYNDMTIIVSNSVIKCIKIETKEVEMEWP